MRVPDCCDAPSHKTNISILKIPAFFLHTMQRPILLYHSACLDRPGNPTGLILHAKLRLEIS